MSLHTLRRPALLLAGAFALIFLGLFLFTANGVEASTAVNVDMKVTFNEDTVNGDGAPNDAIFKVHDAKNKGLAGVWISVRYTSNDTEIVNLSTDTLGYAQLFNMSQDNYTYYAYDNGVLIGWGNFRIQYNGQGWPAQIGHSHSVYIGHQPGLMDDFNFGVKHNEGVWYNESWIEIYNLGGSNLLYSGWANQNDPFGDSWVRAFMQLNLSAGKYWFESWANVSKADFLQNGTFYIVFDAWFYDWEWSDVDWDYDYYNETKQVYFDVDTNAEFETSLIVEVYVYDSNYTQVNFTTIYINVTSNLYDEFWFNYTANFSDYYTVEFYLYDEHNYLYDNFTIYDNWLEVEYEAWFYYYWEWWHGDLDRDGYEETKYIEFDIDSNTANKTKVYVYFEVFDSNGTKVDYKWYLFNVTGEEYDSFIIFFSANFSDWYSFNLTLYDEMLLYEFDYLYHVDNWLEVEYDSWFYYWSYYDEDWDEDGYVETKQIYFDIDTNTANTTWVVLDIYVYDSNGTQVNLTTVHLNVTGEVPDSFIYNYTTDFSDWYSVEVELYRYRDTYRYDNFTIKDNWLEVEFDAFFYYYEYWDIDEDKDGYHETKVVLFDIDTNTANMTEVWVEVYIYDSNGTQVDTVVVSYFVNGTDWDELYFNWTTDFSDYYTYNFSLQNATYYEFDTFIIKDNWQEVEFEAWFFEWDYWDIDDDEDGYYETKTIWFDIDTNMSNETQVWVAIDIYDSNGTLVQYDLNTSFNVSGKDFDSFYINWSTEYSDWYSFEVYLYDVHGVKFDNFTIKDNWLEVEFEAWFFEWDYWDIDDDRDGHKERKIIWFDIDTNMSNKTQVWVSVEIFNSNGTLVYVANVSYNVSGDEVDDLYFNVSAPFSDWYDVYLDLWDVEGNWYDGFTIYDNWVEVKFEAYFEQWWFKDVDQDQDGYNETKVIWYDIDTNTSNRSKLWVEIKVLDSNGTQVDYQELMYYINGTDDDELYFNWSTEFSDDYTFYLSLQNSTDYEWDNITIEDNWLEVEFEAWFYDWDWWDVDWDEDSYNETKLVWFDIDTNTALNETVYVWVYIYDSNGTFIEEGYLEFNVSGEDVDNFYFYYEANFTDAYDFNFTLLNWMYYPEDEFSIEANWLEVPFEAWYYDWYYYDLDLDQDGYYETKSIWFDIDTNTSVMTKLWVEVYVLDSNGTRVEYEELSFLVNGTDMDDFYYNWSTEYSDNYTFYLSLQNETYYEWDNITIRGNWLEVEFEAWFYDWDWWDVDWDEDSYNETKLVWFDIDTNTALNETVYVYVYIYDSNGTLIDEGYGEFNVTGSDIDNFYFDYETDYSDWYTVQFYLEDYWFIEHDNFSIKDNWLEVEFEAYFYDWDWWDLDEDQDGYNETKSIWFDIDTNTANMTQLWVEVYVFDSNGTMMDYEKVAYFINGTDIDDLYFNWSTQYSDFYTFHVSLQNSTNFEWENFTIENNWLEVEFNATFYDWEWWDIDEDEDGYNETKVVWFDIDTNSGTNETVYVYVYIYDSNATLVDTRFLYFNVTGYDEDDLWFAWEAAFSDDYDFEVELLDSSYGYQDGFVIEANWLEVEFEAWFYYYYWFHEDYDEDGFNETKFVLLDINTNTSHKTELFVEVTVYDSNGTQVDFDTVSYNVSGMEFTSDFYMWEAQYSDYYTFEFDLYDEFSTWYDNFTIESNWLEVEFEAWFYEWDYEDLDTQEDGFVEKKSLWFDIDTTTSNTTYMYVDIFVYNSTGSLENQTRMYLYVTGDGWDLFYFNFSADYNDSYTVMVQLYHSNGTYYANFTIEDNWLEVPYEWAWFEEKEWERTDVEGDEFEESLNWTFDVDTWNNYTQKGWLQIKILNSSAGAVEDVSLGFEVSGEDASDIIYWNWSAPYSDTFTFLIEIWNWTNDIRFHNQTHELDLEVVYEWAWFEEKEWELNDLEGDDFEESINWTFDVDTWKAFTQSGVVWIDVYNSSGGFITNTSLPFEVTGEDSSDLLYWNWTALYTDTYTFDIFIYSISFYEFHNQTHDIYLEVAYEWAWFEDKEWEYYDEEGDGANESVNWTFDVDTWVAFTQEGWIVIEIYNLSGLVTTESVQFMVTGEDPTDVVYFNWTTTVTDIYTFSIYIYDFMKVVEFHNQTHDDIELEIFLGNRLPVATIDEVEPDPANEDSKVYFNGTGTDPDGTVAVYEWYIEGVLISTAEDLSIDGIAQGVGTWEVKFRVKDNDGDWSENATTTLTVRDSTKPQLSLLVEPDYDNAKLKIMVKADEDLSELNVSLEYTSARAVEYVTMTPATDGDKRNYTGSYDSIDAGEYEVVAKGNDSAGNENSTTTTAIIKQVTAKKDEPTVVDNKDTTGTKLEINAKNDTSGSVSVSKTSAPAPVSQDQAEAGVKELGLYVSIDIDDSILEDLDFVNITMYYTDEDIPTGVKEEGLVLYHYVESTDTWEVADPTGVNMVENYVWGHVSTFSIFAIFGSNVAPTADAGTAITTKVGQATSFSGSGSDLDGNVVKYEWDFDGDGTYEATSTENGTATHIYTTKGTYTAKLKVTDDKGATGFDTVTVTVGEKGGDDDDDGGFLPGFELVFLALAMGLVSLVHLYRRK